MLVGKKTNSDGSITFTFLSEELHIRSGIQKEKPRVNPRPAPKNPSLNEKLYDAAIKLNFQLVISLLERGANANSIFKDKYGLQNSLLRLILERYYNKHYFQRGDFFKTMKAMLDYGAKINYYVPTLNNHLDTSFVISRRHPTNVLNLLLSHDNSSINTVQKQNQKQKQYSIFREILENPNYHKFRLLLCHGMTLDNPETQQRFQFFFDTFCCRSQNWTRSTVWRKNQHRRKIVSTTLMWRKLMLLYCFVKRNLYAWDLSYLRNTSIKDFVTFRRNEITVHYI
jgi:hypothetical protein